MTRDVPATLTVSIDAGGAQRVKVAITYRDAIGAAFRMWLTDRICGEHDGFDDITIDPDMQWCGRLRPYYPHAPMSADLATPDDVATLQAFRRLMELDP